MSLPSPCVLNVLIVYGTVTISPQLRLNMYWPPADRKWVLICLSALLAPEDGSVACQLMYWFMKSYSNQTVPPAAFGISDGVPTSKTLHPQAQDQLKLGVRVI